ncbi:helix-turn-helix transcriptional regulator [Streptomyces sp. NPDC048720]|uniref:helix-turn-helix transcriptional regulator n=1 Tax=Streptomyces sp. NPDC048720 TaxID=3365588 RepID=UPI0037145D64
MAVNQSYAGTITNPIVEARTTMLISQQGLAKRLGLSKQYLNRAENGTYSSLNPALLKWVGNAMGWDTKSVEGRYKQFQSARRRETVESYAPHQLIRTDSKAAGHEIFSNWRAGYWPSSMAFANAFCIHPDLIQKYEDGIQKSMPKQLRETLTKLNLLDPNWYDDFRAQNPTR